MKGDPLVKLKGNLSHTHNMEHEHVMEIKTVLYLNSHAVLLAWFVPRVWRKVKNG